MPFIKYDSMPLTTGRTVRDACTDLATGAYVCAVDEVLDGDNEISADEHASIKAAAEKAYANQPAPELTPVPEPKPSPLELIISVLAKDKSLSPETQQALAALVTKE